MIKFKILISLMQVIKQLPDVYNIPMPEGWLMVIRVMGAIDFDVVRYLRPLLCDVSFNYHSQLLLRTFGAMGCIGLLAAIAIATRLVAVRGASTFALRWMSVRGDLRMTRRVRVRRGTFAL